MVFDGLAKTPTFFDKASQVGLEILERRFGLFATERVYSLKLNDSVSINGTVISVELSYLVYLVDPMSWTQKLHLVG